MANWLEHWRLVWLSRLSFWYRRLKEPYPFLCPQTQSDNLRIDTLRQSVYSPRRERFHGATCVHCGRAWLLNQHHRQAMFSCGDYVRMSDYDALRR